MQWTREWGITQSSSPDFDTLQKIAFIYAGSFSHINDAVHDILAQRFPGARIDDLDTNALPVWRRSSRLFMAMHAASQYGLRGVRGSHAIHTYGPRTPGFFAAARRQIAERLGSEHYDFTLQTQSLFDGGQPGTPHFVYTDHTHQTNLYYPGFDPANLYAPAWIECERAIYRRARVTFTMSSHVSRSLREHYGIEESKIDCVGAGSNSVVESGDIPDDARYASKHILFVGIDWERKGGPQLLAAFERVLRTHPDARLTIVGCSPSVTTPNVEVLGLRPLSEVAQYYRRASVFCMPTRNEPFGLVFLEAFAHRLPVVASDLGAVPDLVEDGVNGYRVPVDDVDALAARLGSLIASPADCKRFGEAGYAKLGARYSWEAVGRRMAERITREVQMAQAAPRPATMSAADSRLLAT